MQPQTQSYFPKISVTRGLSIVNGMVNFRPESGASSREVITRRTTQATTASSAPLGGGIDIPYDPQNPTALSANIETFQL